MTISIVDHELPDDTHNTYDVTFFDQTIFTTVAQDPTIATQWISEVDSIPDQKLIVGLDVEWRPSFSRSTEFPAATLQLCVAGKCLIFQLIHSPSIPQPLKDFLANPNHTFVGVGIEPDLEKLELDYEFGYKANWVDLRDLAAEKYERKELKQSGVKELVSVVLGKEIDKPKRVTMSRWDNLWLNPDQVQYACIDAFVCFEIGRILKSDGAPASG